MITKTTILKNAIDFALTNPQVAQFIDQRDRHRGTGITEISVKVMKADNQNWWIIVLFDYFLAGNHGHEREDISVNILFSNGQYIVKGIHTGSNQF